MRRFTLTQFLVFAALCFGVSSADAQEGTGESSEGTPEKLEHVQAIAEEAQKSLAELGFPVDSTRVKISLKESSAAYDDFDRTQDMYFKAGYFSEFAALLYALGLVETDDPARLRSNAVGELLQALDAYYQIDTDELVFLDKPDAALSDLFSGTEFLVTHELVHAYQDQTYSLEKLLSSYRETLDGSRVISCLIEGHADWLAMATQVEAERLATLTEEDLQNDLEMMLAGEVSIIYSAGRLLMAQRYQSGGWDAVAETLMNPPPSMEQALHPEKFQSDSPRKIELPDFGLPVVHEDTLGELTCYSLLRLIGEDRSIAYPAAAGWDGDRLVILASGEGEGRQKVLVWRTVWDRELDAEQFATHLSNAAGKVMLNGNVVDWRSDAPDRLAKMIDAALASSSVNYPIVEADSISTAAIEEAWAEKMAASARVEANRWVHERGGVSIELREGWISKEINGMEVLLNEENSDPIFTPNINVQVNPVPPGTTLEQLIKMTKAQVDSLPTLEMKFIREEKISGQPVAFYEMFGKLSPTLNLHFLGVAYLREGQQVTVTATTLESLWEKQQELLLELLLGMKIEELVP